MRVFLSGTTGRSTWLFDDYMRLYMAGGVTGNLNAFFKTFAENTKKGIPNADNYEISAKVFLAGGNGKERIIRDNMKVFLAGTYAENNASENDPKGDAFRAGQKATFGGVYILESYYYLQGKSTFPELIHRFGDFLLDSGAFTFMVNSGNGKQDWDNYVERYADFINKWDVKKFFELDIDSIIGISEVERLRNKLERLTNKQCIPVWHANRGLDYWKKMCEQYNYVALGGIVQPTGKVIKESAFPWFIGTAHARGAKVHGLGYTKIEGLKKYKFDSVDSTAWIYGNRGGYLYKFNPLKGTIDKIPAKEGYRLNSRMAALNNFSEWVKFQRWADKNL